MEDDLYGGIESAEGAFDANLYEGLFTGPSSSGHHETYLQHKVNELEDALRERKAEIQTLKTQLRDRNQELLDVTTERDILLRNISCLYNTAKEEMARKQTEINNLRTELAQAKQHQAQQQQRPQRGPHFALPPAAAAFAPGAAAAAAAVTTRPTKQPPPAGAGSKRGREPDALEALERPHASNGKLRSTAAEDSGTKRSRCDVGRAIEPPAAGRVNGIAVGGAATGAAGDRSSAPQPQRSSLQREPAAAGEPPPQPPAAAAAITRRINGCANGHDDAAAEAACCELSPADGALARPPQQHVASGDPGDCVRLDGRCKAGHGGANGRSAAGPHAGAAAGGGDSADNGGGAQRGDPPSRHGRRGPLHERDGRGPGGDAHSRVLRGADRPGGAEGTRGGDCGRERGRDGSDRDRGRDCSGQERGREDFARERSKEDGGRDGGREDGRQERSWRGREGSAQEERGRDGDGADGGRERGREGGGRDRGRDDNGRERGREEGVRDSGRADSGLERGRVDFGRERERERIRAEADCDMGRARPREDRDLSGERREGRGSQGADREQRPHHSRHERS